MASMPSGLQSLGVDPGWSPPEEFDEYRLVRLLGRGAMGQVYLAHDSLLDRPVALKFVRADNPETRARFFEEARAIARLQHPNVVAIYRVAEVAQHPYLVAEYVRGRTLDLIDRPVPWRQALELALDLARGLAAAHRCGVLHRDVKPANTMLTDDGRAKLLDFGLARITTAKPGEEVPPEPARGSAPTLSPVPDLPGPRPRRTSEGGDPSLSSGAARAIRRPLSNRSQNPVGTPLYMAPEVWRGEPATRRSDLYSLGILLYELLAGTAPFRHVPLSELGAVVQSCRIPRLAEAAPGVQPALVAIVERLIERDPSARFPSADALLIALEELTALPARPQLPGGNPYRGLAAFGSTHGSLFFGRQSEIHELVERVRAEPFVVVCGDSGTGKSSLCRAGALPWLAEHEGWACVDVVPGRHPAHALTAALAAWTGADEIELAALLPDSPEAFARAIRQSLGSGRRLLLFVDQLEELLTLSDPEEARVIAATLAALAVRTPSVRVLATCRSDFLSRLAMLPGLADEIPRGLYFLPPLTGERIREVIVRPAAAKGVAFESEELVDDLLNQAAHAPGGLPLLSFTLAELWETRDATARIIRAESLAILGGVGGALSRHADRLLLGLGDDERHAARRVLLRLVTAEGTRARRTEAELLTDGPTRVVERSALEVLVRGRIVIANDTANDTEDGTADGAYEIAHEALLSSWTTLQDWLQRDAADHVARARVAQAAAAWERTGRARDRLWGRRELTEIKGLTRTGMASHELAFLAAARRAIRRRWLLGAAIAAVLVVSAVAIGLAVRARARREFESVVAQQLRQATAAHTAAREIAEQRDAARSRALGMFDAQRWSEGEEMWSRVEALALQEEEQYRLASSHLESTLQLDPGRAGLRDAFADLTFERMLRAERDRQRNLADELAGRMAAYGSDRHQIKLSADARLELEIDPAGTEVWSEQAGAPRQLLGRAPLAALTLPPGSRVLAFEAPGRVTARLPLLLAREQTRRLRVVLPEADSAPPGMIYVPPGPFLFGSADSSDVRRGFLNAAPLHEVGTGGYYIGRNEVTFAEWIEFLEDLLPEERRLRRPSAVAPPSSLSLTQLGPHRWRLEMTPTGARTYTAETGQRLRYESRARRAEQDWTRFPVAAVSYEDAVAFAAWLARTGRIPGARLCDEREWERAARGADARTFPGGAALGPDDANIDATYGRESPAIGPDEVGSHPDSRSPIGAHDMAGNVWEWTRSVETPGAQIARGGSWYTASLSARSTNRERVGPTLRHPSIGVRLCASPK